MRYYIEKPLKYFDFWGGAKDRVEYLSTKEIEKIEEYLDELDIEWSETEINDFFWFHENDIAKILGYEDFDHLMIKKKIIPWA